MPRGRINGMVIGHGRQGWELITTSSTASQKVARWTVCVGVDGSRAVLRSPKYFRRRNTTAPLKIGLARWSVCPNHAASALRSADISTATPVDIAPAGLRSPAAIYRVWPNTNAQSRCSVAVGIWRAHSSRLTSIQPGVTGDPMPIEIGLARWSIEAADFTPDVSRTVVVHGLLIDSPCSISIRIQKAATSAIGIKRRAAVRHRAILVDSGSDGTVVVPGSVIGILLAEVRARPCP